MYWGIIYYQFIYNETIDKVIIRGLCLLAECTSTILHEYTREECQHYAQVYKGVCPLYRVALQYFPKEISNETQ